MGAWRGGPRGGSLLPGLLVPDIGLLDTKDGICVGSVGGCLREVGDVFGGGDDLVAVVGLGTDVGLALVLLWLCWELKFPTLPDLFVDALAVFESAAAVSAAFFPSPFPCFGCHV